MFKNILVIENNEREVLNGSYSDYSSIESGVPQVSVIGPILFLVCINFLKRNIKSIIKLFAELFVLNVYHIPSRQTRVGLTVNALMEKNLKEFNTKQLLLSPVHGKVHVAQSSMWNYTSTNTQVILKTNSLESTDL